MSIRKKTNELINAAIEELGDKGGYVDFKIGMKKIEIKYHSNWFVFSRWFDGIRNITTYSVHGYIDEHGDGGGSVLKTLLNYVFQYFDLYNEFKNTEGYVVVHESKYGKSYKINEYLITNGKFNIPKEDLKLASLYFHSHAHEGLVSAYLPKKELDYIHNAFETIKNFKTVLNNKPLCYLSTEIENLINTSVIMDYHGEKISCYINNKQDNPVLDVTLTKNIEQMELPFPTPVSEIEALLQKISDENQVLNTLTPDTIYFEKAINKVLSFYDEESILTEYQKVVNEVGSWEKVELIFKELIEQFEENKKDRYGTKTPFVLVTDFKDNVTGKHIKAYRAIVDEFSFWITESDYSEGKNREEICAFVSEPLETPNAFLDYTNKHMNKIIQSSIHKMNKTI